MTDSSELAKFRDEWKREIKRSRMKPSCTYCSLQCKKRCVSSCEDETSRTITGIKNCHKTASIFENKYNAFSIANKYLSLETNIVSDNHQGHSSVAFMDNINKIETRTNDVDIDGILHQSNPSNYLVDVLIHDIDECVGIAFFDFELPKEIAIKIFSFLDLQDLGHCALVSWKWKILSETDILWYRQCLYLGLEPGVSCAAERINWKRYVKQMLETEESLCLNWKGRLCEVSELEYEKGGLLLSASVDEASVISGYKNGVVKLWNLRENKPALELRDNSGPDDHKSPVTKTTLSDNICAAGYVNGDIFIWDKSGHVVHHFNVGNEIICIDVTSQNVTAIGVAYDQFLEVHMCSQGDFVWKMCFQKKLESKVLGMMFVNLARSQKDSCFIAVHTKSKLLCCSLNGTDIELENFEVGAQLSCIESADGKIVCGISPLGYSALEGYLIRGYECVSGKMIFSLSGTQSILKCINASAMFCKKLVVGCSDFRVRVHDIDVLLVHKSFSGLQSYPTAVQVDDWKVVGGGANGMVCVWNETQRTLLWKTNLRHRTTVIYFTKSFLVTVHVPEDKHSRENNWYADDLIEHRRYRGTIRFYDFAADTLTKGIPEICKSNFDNVSGYNYNISLMTPFDDVS